MGIVSNSLTMMEDSIMDLFTSKDTEISVCKRLSSALGALPFNSLNRGKMDIHITNHDKSEKLFGVRVFPDIGELTHVSTSFVNSFHNTTMNINGLNKKWRDCIKWVIELDHSLFDMQLYNFTPKEIIALILQEIGFVIYSDTVPTTFYNAFMEARNNLSEKQKANLSSVDALYVMPLALGCLQRRWITCDNQIREELIANKSLDELGYKPYLESALEKIYKITGSMDATDISYYKEILTSVQWCNGNSVDIIKRKDHLRDELYYQATRAKSPYVKALTIVVLDKMGTKLREKYNGYVVENSMELISDPELLTKYTPIFDVVAHNKYNRLCEMKSKIALEGLFNKRKKIKVELPSNYEVDSIAVEVDKISNHHDRIFVLDLIYEILDRVNSFEETISAEPALINKWEVKIRRMKDHLEELRLATLAKKNFSKGYKFFVPVPEGYEG